MTGDQELEHELKQGMSDFEGSGVAKVGAGVGVGIESLPLEDDDSDGPRSRDKATDSTSLTSHEVVSVVFREKWSVKEDTVCFCLVHL